MRIWVGNLANRIRVAGTFSMPGLPGDIVLKRFTVCWFSNAPSGRGQLGKPDPIEPGIRSWGELRLPHFVQPEFQAIVIIDQPGIC
jgi:hypothetical protein